MLSGKNWINVGAYKPQHFPAGVLLEGPSRPWDLAWSDGRGLGRTWGLAGGWPGEEPPYSWSSCSPLHRWSVLSWPSWVSLDPVSDFLAAHPLQKSKEFRGKHESISRLISLLPESAVNILPSNSGWMKTEHERKDLWSTGEVGIPPGTGWLELFRVSSCLKFIASFRWGFDILEFPKPVWE